MKIELDSKRDAGSDIDTGNKYGREIFPSAENSGEDNQQGGSKETIIEEIKRPGEHKGKSVTKTAQSQELHREAQPNDEADEEYPVVPFDFVHIKGSG